VKCSYWEPPAVQLSAKDPTTHYINEVYRVPCFKPWSTSRYHDSVTCSCSAGAFSSSRKLFAAAVGQSTPGTCQGLVVLSLCASCVPLSRRQAGGGVVSQLRGTTINAQQVFAFLAVHWEHWTSLNYPQVAALAGYLPKPSIRTSWPSTQTEETRTS